MADRVRTRIRWSSTAPLALVLLRLCSVLTGGRTRRAFWRYWVADLAMGAGSYALHYLLRPLPFDACSAIGGRLGLLVGWFRRSGGPLLNARNSFARLRQQSAGKRDLDSAMRRMCANIGRVYAEYNILDLLWDAGRITVTGEEHLAALRDRRHPIVVLGVHLTSWEVIGATLIGLGYEVYTLYRPARNRFQDRIAVAVRTGKKVGRKEEGAKLVPPGVRGVRQAYRILAEHGGLFLTWVDEAVDGNARVPAFNRPVYEHGNLAAVVRLARATRAGLVPAYVERRDGARFHTTFGPPVELIRGEDQKAVLRANLRHLDALISRIILPRLEEWWMLRGLRLD
jgi:Kdo2-lipid IVA lauroyltransferase/acyltransferase